MIDDEDKQAIGEGVLRLAVIVAVILIGAVVAGFALRLFQIVSGI